MQYDPRTFRGLTFHDALPGFREGSDTPRAYLERCLEVIDVREPVLQALVATDIEGAREAADASADRWRAGRALSPVDGMPVGIKDVLAHRQAHSEDSLTEHVRGGRYSPVMTRSRGHPGKNEGRRFGRGGLQGCGFALASLLPPTQRSSSSSSSSSSSKTQAKIRPLGDRIIGRCRSFVKRWAGGAADSSATAGFSVTRWKNEGFTTTA